MGGGSMVRGLLDLVVGMIWYLTLPLFAFRFEILEHFFIRQNIWIAAHKHLFFAINVSSQLSNFIIFDPVIAAPKKGGGKDEPRKRDELQGVPASWS